MAKKRTTKKQEGAKKRMERDIRRAVDSIPELLAEKADLTDMRREHEPAQTIARKRRMLALGVASFSLLIISLWYWNARTFVSRVFAAQSAEAEIVQRTTKNFQDTFNAVTAVDEAARMAREADAAAREVDIASVLLSEFSSYITANAATSTATTTTDTLIE